MIDPILTDADGEAPRETVNAADKKSLRRARTRAKIVEEQERLFWRQVFGNETGRRAMWNILQSGHAFEERFSVGPSGFPQPEATWCEAGEQRFAFRLWLSWLKICPEGAALMMTEHHPSLRQVKKAA